MLEKSQTLYLREEFLSAMSTVANSVTIVTTDGAAGLSGATVSSFCSVSADPPMLLVCLNKTAQTCEAAKKNGKFAISILDEGSRQIATAFAQPQTDKGSLLESPNWQRVEGYAPVLANATSFCCDITEIAEASSHLVMIGKVTKVHAEDQKPLVYLNRQFCKVTGL